MENRRLFSFILTSLLFLWLWTAVVAPKFFPPPKKAPVAINQPKPPAQEDPVPGDAGAWEAGAVDAAVANVVIPSHPRQKVQLGSDDPAAGFALSVQVTSSGAAIESVSLTAPQYRDLHNTKFAAQIVGNNSTEDKTFSTAILAIDKQLSAQNQTLETANWKLVEQKETDSASSAVFEYDAPDGSLRVRKSFTLPRLKLTGTELAKAWRENPTFYTLQVTLEVVNLTDLPKTFDYELQGPVGLLLENEEHASKFRDIHIEFVDDAKPATLAAATIRKFCDKIDEDLNRPASPQELRAHLREDQEWTSPFRYAGLDVQFFAALIAPIDDRSVEERTQSKLLERTYPVLISRNAAEASRSDISFRMVSMPVTLKAKGDSVIHKYAFFVGPKRRELLDPAPLQASQVLNYGMFGFVARGMHYLLDFFFTLGMPYFLAIISLTILVRGLLFPISRKQAISAARMKELQPQLTALKEKFGADREKMAKAQMELWRKNKINPIGGCLPLLLQLPIFVGLYTALNSAVDLRLQSFLWVENLAGPDALFRLPFSLPYLGRDFSIFPLCTVALFLIQQKLFMPPAQDEQQAMQYKMMNMMTGVMGFMFWHQPAGLCLYFIASSVWSIAERKLLGTGKPVLAGPSVEVIIPTDESAPRIAKKHQVPVVAAPVKPPGFLQRLMNAAHEAQRTAEQQREKDERKGKNNGRRK